MGTMLEARGWGDVWQARGKSGRWGWVLVFLWIMSIAAGRVEAAPGIAWAAPVAPRTDEQDVCNDAAGNLYVAGGVIAKYNAAGQKLWTYSRASVDFKDIAVDDGGNVYACGVATAPLLAERGYDTTLGGDRDGFVVKLNSQGILLWSSYLGGGDRDSAYGVSFDGSGNVYVVGETSSQGWVSGGHSTTFARGFLVKLSAAGGHVWSTYLGSAGSTEATDVVAKSSGKVYVVGTTDSNAWVSGGYDTTLGGQSDAFLAKFSPEGEATWSTLIGGSNIEAASGVALDGDEVYVTGRTRSDGWVSGGYDLDRASFEDGFVVKVSGVGEHMWSTYFGGSNNEVGKAIAVDGSGNAYVTGKTDSIDWAAPDGTAQPRGAFYLKLTANGGLVEHRGFAAESAGGIAVNAAGEIFLAGSARDAQWLFDAMGVTPSDPLDLNFLCKIVDPAPTGSLRVAISPPEVAAIGKWRRVGTSVWQASGIVESNLPAGVYPIEFQTISGWRGAKKLAVVTGSAQTELTGLYVRNAGPAWLDWSSYVGASRRESVVDVAVDASGNIYLLGSCFATDFGNGTITPRFLGTGTGAFVMKVSPAGQHLWTTLLGNGSPYRLGVNAVGRVVVSGTLSRNADWIFGGFKTSIKGEDDAFVVALNGSDGTAAWGTYLGVADELINPNSFVNVRLGGMSVSPNSRVVLSGIREKADLDSDGNFVGIAARSFVMMIGPSGTHVWSQLESGDRLYRAVSQNSFNESVYVAGDTVRFLNANGDQGGFGIHVDGSLGPVLLDDSGSCFVGGSRTNSAFVTKLDRYGEGGWTREFGGPGDVVSSLELGPDGKIFVAGVTGTAGWVSGGFDTVLNDPAGEVAGTGFVPRDVFLVELSATGAINWSTYIGGGGHEIAPQVAFDGNQSLVVAGNTSSRGSFSGGFDSIYNTDIDGETGDGFVARIVLEAIQNGAPTASWMLYE